RGRGAEAGWGAVSGGGTGQGMWGPRLGRSGRRRVRSVCVDSRPTPSAAAGCAGLARGAAGDGIVLARLVGPLLLHRRLEGTGPALLVDPEGVELRRERRHRGSAHDLAPRAARRPTQLGLSLLLAARCDLDAH